MTKRRRTLVVLAVALLAAALYALFHPHAEPSYKGRSLSSWLANFDSELKGPDFYSYFAIGQDTRYRWKLFESPRSLETVEAVCQIGTNALPCLISWIRYEPPEWEAKLNQFLDAAGISWNLGADKRLRANRAVIAFHILRERAAPAIPELNRLINNPAQGACFWRCMSALPAIGEAAIPPLANLMTDPTRQTDMRIIAAECIASMGTNARPAVPSFIQCFWDQDSKIREVAAVWLVHLEVPPAALVSALTNVLQDTNANVRRSAAFALGEIQVEARSATPGLLKILIDPDVKVCETASNALRRIAPEVLTNTPAGTPTPPP